MKSECPIAMSDQMLVIATGPAVCESKECVCPGSTVAPNKKIRLKKKAIGPSIRAKSDGLSKMQYSSLWQCARQHNKELGLGLGDFG